MLNRRSLFTGLGFIALEAGVKCIPIIATNSAGASEFQRNVTISEVAAGLTLLGTVDVLSTDGSNTQTDMPIQFGLVFAPGDFLSSERIVVRDGETALAVQEFGRTTDRNGDIRTVGIYTRVPTIAASAQRTLSIFKETGAPARSNGRTVAQLLALDTDVQCTVSFNDGMARTSKFRDAAAGSTTWNKANAHRRDGFISDGPIAVEFYCSDPQRAGGTADDHLRTFFQVTYFFNANDTLRCVRFAPRTTNAYVDQASPTERHGSASVTTGIASPVTWKTYANETPAVELTVATSGTTTRAVTSAVPGTFTINDHGKVIKMGSERGKIVTVTADGAGCTLRGGTSIVTGTWPSGAWTKHGMVIHRRAEWGTEYGDDYWWGTQPKYVVLPNRDKIFASKMVLNYAQPSANISMTNNNFGDGRMENGGRYLEALTGNHPMAMNNNRRGERTIQDAEPEARVFPNFYVSSLRKIDASGNLTPEGMHRITRNAYLWANQNPIQALDDLTGLAVKPGDGGRANFDEDDYLPGTGGTYNPICNLLHEEHYHYIPYLLTHDFRFLVAAEMQFVRIMYENGTNAINREWWAKNLNVRMRTWNDRTAAQFAAMIPASLPSALLAYTQAQVRAKLDYTWGLGFNKYANYPNVWSGGPNNTPPAPFRTHAQNSADGPGGYQSTYMCYVSAHIHEIGEETAARAALTEGTFRNIVQLYVNEDFLDMGASHEAVRQSMFGIDHGINQVGPGPYYATYADAYAALLAQSQSVNIYGSYEWGAHVLNKEHGFSGTVGEQTTAYDWVQGFMISDGVIEGTGTTPDEFSFRLWLPYARENYIKVRS